MSKEEHTSLQEHYNPLEKTRVEIATAFTDTIAFINALENPTNVESRLKHSLQLLFEVALTNPNYTGEEYPSWIQDFGTAFFKKIIAKIRLMSKETSRINLKLACIDETGIPVHNALHEGMGVAKEQKVNAKPIVVKVLEPGWQKQDGSEILKRAKVLTARSSKN